MPCGEVKHVTASLARDNSQTSRKDTRACSAADLSSDLAAPTQLLSLSKVVLAAAPAPPLPGLITHLLQRKGPPFPHIFSRPLVAALRDLSVS